MSMNAHKLAATLKQDGTLVLKGLPFQAGDRVEIIILEQTQGEGAVPASDRPLQEDALRDDETAVTVMDADYLDAVTATLVEWESDADASAYEAL